MWLNETLLYDAWTKKKPKNTTFQFVVVRVGREEHVWKEFLKAVSGVARPVFYICPYWLVQFHEEVLRWSA